MCLSLHAPQKECIELLPCACVCVSVRASECESECVYLLSRVGRQDGYRGEVGAGEREREERRTSWLEHHSHLLTLVPCDLEWVSWSYSSYLNRK